MPSIMLPRDLSLPLFIDLYELTMAQAYWQNGMTAEATFSLYFRETPPDRAYFVFAGLCDVLDYLEGLHLSGDDVAYLRSMDQFDEEFLNYLGQLRFTGSVRAMPEGTIFFVNEPVIEVTAPVIEAQLAETFILNQVNLQTLLATKASRVVHAARGKVVVDFAARRAHGTDAANKLARVSYMVGFAGTSNVLGGKLYGIPTFGTMAHSFITTFEDEVDSFRAYARSFPDTSTFLVDTYDTLEGTKKAIEVGREMKREGHALGAIRLDSGDLLNLSLRARAMLDEADMPEIEIFASGGLDEFAVDALLEAGAPINGFGVGTKVGVSADAPWTDCVYKLVEYQGRPVLKLSTEKETMPGPKQVYRRRGVRGEYQLDLITRACEPAPSDGSEPLLGEVMRGGKSITPNPTLNELRARFGNEFECIPDRLKGLRSPSHYEVTTSADLVRLQKRVAAQVREREFGAPPVKGR